MLCPVVLIGQRGTAEASLVRALMAMYRPELIKAVLMISGFAVFAFLTPAIFMQELIRFAGGEYSEWYGAVLAVAMMCS